MPSSPRSRSRAASDRGRAGRRRRSSSRISPARCVAAAPAYLKSHSQGEYVFDHGWADAWERAGGQYYPKLQVAVPFTPVPGSRLLGDDPQQLLGAIEAVTSAERPVVGAHHLCRRGEARPNASARLADPPRNPISLAQSRLFELRRFPRRADQPQAQGDPQGAGGGVARAGDSGRCAATRSARPNGMRCGPSTRTPAAANGGGPI